MKASLLGKLWRIARQLHKGGSVRAWCKRVKFCLRGLAFPSATTEWFNVLETPALTAVVRRRPELFQKPQRPFLASTFRTEQRLEALTQHYQFILSHFPPAWLREIHAYPGKCLGVLAGPDGGHYELRLLSSWTEREGELSLALRSRESGATLFSLTFAMVRWEAGQGDILIGGIQGNRKANDKDLIISLTRQWHGLRPRALLLFALHQLAAGWNATRVRAVSDATHVYRRWKKGKPLAFCHDDWWLEVGGHRAEDGLFDLPERFAPRDLATVKGNKRSMYRQRYEMLEDLGRQISASLGCPFEPWLATREAVARETTTRRPTPELVVQAVQPLAG